VIEEHPASRLRIYLGESDHVDGHSTYEWLVLQAREQGLAGATAFRAPLGFGHASRLHTAKILRLSADLPMVVEMVDSPDRLRAFLDRVGEKLGSGLVTLEPVTVVTVVPTTREGV
jgi:uncharacterized protein